MEDMTLQGLAQFYANAFETVTRDNGTTIAVIRDDFPEADSLSDFIRDDLHSGGSMFPDDWTFSETRDAFQAIADHDGDAESAEDDAEADIATFALLCWLRDYRDALDVCDEACEELGHTGDTLSRISVGQWYARRRIIAACGNFLLSAPSPE